LQATGLIVYVGEGLAPLMKLMGLPGEMGLVWASAMIGNIYAGMVAYFSIASQLTVAQITTLSTVILVAHSLPIELGVTKKAGAKIITLFLVRFGFGFIAGIILFQIYKLFGTLNYYPEMVNQIVIVQKDSSFWVWVLSELKNYFIIFLLITVLIILLDLLKKIGVIELVNKALYPVLKILGIGKEVIPITVFGMTLGLAYGGGLIINEVEKNDLKKRDVFYALLLMSLCHSLIEDSLLMISIGAHYSGVFIFRTLFALILTYLFVQITKRWSDEKMAKWFYA
jgi:spore maturation protein SpmB